eukprot:6173171-Pleurochrysis_carterae.AAC.2
MLKRSTNLTRYYSLNAAKHLILASREAREESPASDTASKAVSSCSVLAAGYVSTHRGLVKKAGNHCGHMLLLFNRMLVAARARTSTGHLKLVWPVPRASTGISARP